MLSINKNVRNVAIVLILAALVVAIPGGGSGASIAIQAISLAFLGAAAWVAAQLYRQHRLEIYALGDTKRAIVYIAVGVAAVTLTATHRLWATGPGEIAWLALMGGAIYAVVAVVWSARKY
ncbi:MAG TPA: hypothetical protein VGI87_03215 [Solirubrobacteraceae bacterium]|jgi:O-antigen/teichoic acid export membrane protein